ncbi:MAG: agmatinase [Archaeoglobales archaeon]|nr:agmatinase [Archaeoglobales archaeon]
MHIDSYFCLSKFDLRDADYVIYGIPYDATQSFKPGSRFAPTAIREASWNIEEFSHYFNYDLSEVRLHDAGNVNCDGSFLEIAKRVEEFTSKIDCTPIALGGEHSVSVAAARKFRNATFLVLDAHFDLRDEFDGDKFNHACTTRRIYESGMNVVIAGVRSGPAEEVEFVKKNGISFFYAWDFDADKIAREIEGDVYLSIDMDVFDPAYAPGVSTPEPFGISPIQFLKLLEKISSSIVAFDIVEVVPDACRITSALAAKLIFETIAAIEKTKI